MVIEIVGLGKDPLKLVERALELRRKGEYDQVWCVFDRDDVPAERFNQALDRAQQRGIKVAYSNQAFELWVLLHFQYCDAALSRRDYRDKLSLALARAYRKNDTNLYLALLPLQDAAIRHAEHLLSQNEPANPAADDPSTTVHLLVKELNRFVQNRRF